MAEDLPESEMIQLSLEGVISGVYAPPAPLEPYPFQAVIDMEEASGEEMEDDDSDGNQDAEESGFRRSELERLSPNLLTNMEDLLQTVNDKIDMECAKPKLETEDLDEKDDVLMDDSFMFNKKRKVKSLKLLYLDGKARKTNKTARLWIRS
jgi:hypothetical protein